MIKIAKIVDSCNGKIPYILLLVIDYILLEVQGKDILKKCGTF